MRTTRIFMAVAALVLAVAAVRAVSAWPGLHTVRQPDGTTLTYRVAGDEHYHGFTTADGYMIKPDSDGAMRYVTVAADGTETLSSVVAHDSRLRSVAETAHLRAYGTSDFGSVYRRAMLRRAPVRRLPGGEFPTTGNLKGVVLLVEFADNSMQEGNDSRLFRSVMNDEGYSLGGATGSARDYFVAQSMGKFTPEFDVYGPIKLKKSMMYYGANDRQGNDSKPGLMVREACEYAEKELGVDFTRYDYNGDGIVDFVYIIYAGYAESYGASSNTIWPHASNLVSLGIDCRVSGLQVQRYACSSELKYVSGTQLEGIGTFCHEFGHVLGLPDMYNTYNQQSVQLGSWDIMDTGSYNNESHTPPAYSAFERFSLGWLEFTDIDTPADSMTLEELTQNNVAYRIRTADENEFFTLENRQQQGWDAYQPGRGLMIIHVAYEKSAWDGNFVNAGTIRRYDLVEADGTQGTPQATDLYPAGGDMFTDYSTPNSLAWDGTPTEKGVTNIRDNGGVIFFRFMKDRLLRPVAVEVGGVTQESFTARWQPVDGARSYRLCLREILPDSLNPVVADEDFSAMTAGEYPKYDNTDISDELDSYTSLPGWYGSRLYQAGGYLLVGYYGMAGQLVSPPLDLSAHGGAFTVAFHAVSYPGKTVGYTVSATDISSGEVTEKYSLKADKTESEVVLRFHSGGSRTRITVGTSNERVYLNNLRILKDSVPAVEIWTAGPREWTVDSIAGTEYEVTGLVPGRTYVYTVVALSQEELLSSLPSDEIEVTTAGLPVTDGIAAQSSSPVVSVAYYDMSGRKTASPVRGLFIRKTTFADGTVRAEKCVR